MTAAALPVVHDDSTPGIRVEQVRVGERARKDYGDLEPLKASITEHGLLQPIVLLPDDYLLCGGRRLEACRQLGWESIPFVRSASQTDAISRLKAERDENTCRKEMTPSELVAIGRKLEELKRPEAEQRQAEGQRLGGQIRQGTASWPVDQEAAPSKGTRAEVAEAVGMTESTYKRARRVVDAAEDESAPQPVRQAASEARAEMDAGTLSISAAENKVKEAQRRAADEADAPKRVHLSEPERVEQIKPLAASGHTSDQIGREIGVGEEQVKAIARRNEIDIPADRVMARTRRMDHTRFVAKTVEQIATVATGLDGFDPARVDWTQQDEWVTSLTDSLRALNRFVNAIRKATQ